MPRNSSSVRSRHLVEKETIVADHQQRAGGVAEEPFEPLRGLHIEMVRWLVQQHEVRFFQQQPSHEQAILLSAAELLDGLMKRLGSKAQPLEDAFDLVIQMVAVAVLQRVV